MILFGTKNMNSSNKKRFFKIPSMTEHKVPINGPQIVICNSFPLLHKSTFISCLTTDQKQQNKI